MFNPMFGRGILNTFLRLFPKTLRNGGFRGAEKGAKTARKRVKKGVCEVKKEEKQNFFSLVVNELAKK